MTDGAERQPTALVTGASGGIGRATVLELLGREWHVVATGRDGTRLKQLEESATPRGARLSCVTADLRSAADHARLVHTVRNACMALDLLVNNAGVAALTGVSSMTDTQLDDHLEINVKAPARLVRDLLPLLERACLSQVINIASEQALRPQADNGLYGASKAALIFLTRAWAAELAPAGIRVNCLLPGAVDTAMLRATVHPADVAVPLGRRLQPADIAEWIPLLIDAHVVTGAAITVDGGTSL